MSQARCVCPACRSHVTPIRPGIAAKVGYVAVWAYSLAVVAAAGMTGPFLLMLAPIVAVMGVGLISYMHEKAFTPPRCPACERFLPEEALIADQRWSPARGQAGLSVEAG